jgi:uncharacterized membrane protein
MVFQPDLILFITNNIRTIHGKFLLPCLLIVFIIVFGIYYFNYYRKKVSFEKKDNKVLLYLLLILIIGIVWPSLKFFKIFDLPFFNFDWMQATKNPIGIFSLSLSFSIFLYQFLISKTKIWSRISKTPDWLIYVLIGLGSILYMVSSILKYNHFQLPSMDFGLSVQAIWEYSHFMIPAASSIRHLHNILADHFHPIWILVSALFWIWRDPRTLLIFDSIIVSFGSLAIYWMAKKILNNNLTALILSFGYLFFIGIQLALDFPFRGDTLATTFLVFAIWFLYNKKWLKYFIMVVLILMSKESFGLYILFLGIFAIVWRKEWKVGIITALAGAIWFMGIVGYVIPHLRGGPYHIFTYSQLGSSFGQVLKTIILNPFYTIHVFTNPVVKINTILTLFGAGGFLIFLCPVFLILAIPMLFERFLSTDTSFWVLLFHYSVTLTPVIFMGAIFGAHNLIKKYTNEKILPIVTFLIFFSTIFISCAWRTPLLHLAKKSFYKPEPQVATISQAIKLISSDAMVTTQDTIVPNLAMRKQIYQYPDYLTDSQFDLFDTRSGTYPIIDKKFYTKSITDLINNPKYGIIYSQGSTILFEKNTASKVRVSNEVNAFIENNK